MAKLQTATNSASILKRRELNFHNLPNIQNFTQYPKPLFPIPAIQNRLSKSGANQ
jgi:hypothetical protein